MPIPLFRAGAAALALCLITTACSSSASDKSGGTSGASSKGASTTGAGGGSPASGAPVKIGLIFEQGANGDPSGPNGTRATAAYYNKEKKGIDGHPIQLVECGENADAASVQSCARKFANDPTIKAVIVGGSMQVADDVLYQNLGSKLAIVGCCPASAAAFGAKDAYWYGSGSFGVIPGLGVLALKTLKNVKSALLIYLDIPSLKQTVQGLLVPVLEKAGVKVKQQTIAPTATDVLGPLTAGGASSADVVMPIMAAPQCIQLAKGLKQLNSKAAVIGSPLCFDPSVQKAAGSAIEGWYEVQIGGGIFAEGAEATDAKRVLATYGSKDVAAQGAFAFANYGVSSSLFDTMTKLGFANLTPESVAAAVKAYTGSVPLLAPSIKCGVFAAAPSVCNPWIKAFQIKDGKVTPAAGGDYINIANG